MLTFLAAAMFVQDPGSAAPAQQLPPVVVSATRRGPAAPGADIGLSVVTGDELRRTSARVDVVDALRGVPGVQVRDRHNYAQDLQISVRGFGARAAFGVRGVRLFVNGIPASAADGQGQLAHGQLDHTTRIEVLRGPHAALYGNASGAVIHVIADPAAMPAGAATSASASNDFQRVGARFSAASAASAVSIAAARFDYEGFRPHSAARRGVVDVIARGSWGSDWHWSAALNALSLPQAEDPLGLSRAEFERDPDSTNPAALEFNTRKRVRQNQVGFGIARHAANGELQLAVHAGQRAVEQFLAIPVAVQSNPRHPGGVVDLARDYAGVDGRWSRTVANLGGELRATLGFCAQGLHEQRRGYANFAGAALGVRGALRRDERNTVRALDTYARLDWRPAEPWLATLAVRASRLRIGADDRYITASNPDDSGAQNYSDYGPLVGLAWQGPSGLRWHLAYAEGFETPTLNELAYRSDGSAGLNLSLEPAHNRQTELRLRWQISPESRLESSVFRVASSGEIVVASNSGGRAGFRNAGSTERLGAEIGAEFQIGERDTLAFSWTWLDARYADAFNVCITTPCVAAAAVVAADSRIPGVPAQHGLLEWRHRLRAGWSVGMAVEHLGRVVVDDLNRDAAASYDSIDLFAARAFVFGEAHLQAFARLSNASDRRYAGSVIVNEGNGRFFEPAPGRQWLLGLEIAWH